MLKDKLMLGAIIGLLSDAVKLTSNYAMYKLGWTNVVFWQIVASRFLEKNDLNKPAALLVGAVADLTVSAVLGVIFVLFISLFGGKYLFFKGIGYGMFIWVGILGTLLDQSVQGKLPQTLSGIIVTMIAHFIFGLSIAVFTKLLAKDLTLSDKLTDKIKSYRMNFPLAPKPASKPTCFRIKNQNSLSKPIKLKPRKLINSN
ncbi:MAG: hypothetical protein VR72_00130 [Clostridiaceae bacterium BRH_c20a]|nr:MAG: hypothetical protein VR72_00130 [Clostridiaceae bacterium BRH_c20a]